MLGCGLASRVTRGRLCDIRQIVYGAADRPSRIPWELRFALRPDLLRENIDGEALEWAGSRLDRVRWDRRVICVLSDGSPVRSRIERNDCDLGGSRRRLVEYELRLWHSSQTRLSADA